MSDPAQSTAESETPTRAEDLTKEQHSMPLYPGKPVLYRFRPGAVRMGQTEAAAMITRIYQDGTCDLTVSPPSSPEPLFQNRVPQMAREEDFHCWRFNDDEARIATLEAQVVSLSDRLVELEMAQPQPPRLQEISNALAAGETVSIQDAPRRGRPRARTAETT